MTLALRLLAGGRTTQGRVNSKQQHTATLGANVGAIRANDFPRQAD